MPSCRASKSLRGGSFGSKAGRMLMARMAAVSGSITMAITRRAPLTARHSRSALSTNAWMVLSTVRRTFAPGVAGI